VCIAPSRTCSSIFKKRPRYRRGLCAGALGCSSQFASNLRRNMGWSMGQSVRRNVGIDRKQRLGEASRTTFLQPPLNEFEAIRDNPVERLISIDDAVGLLWE
jgi:hypothetical protein